MKIILETYRHKPIGPNEQEAEILELTPYEAQHGSDKEIFVRLKLLDRVGSVKVDDLEKAIKALS